MRSPSVFFVTRHFGNARGGIGQYEESLFPLLEDHTNVALCPIQSLDPPRWAHISGKALGLDIQSVAANHPWRLPTRNYADALIHFTNQNMGPSLLLYRKHRTIITVHDIIPYLQMIGTVPSYQRDFDISTRLTISLTFNALRAANRLIADSNSTKSDLVKYLGIEKEKIDVVYLGVDRQLFMPFDNRPNRRVYGIEEQIPLVLYVGSQNPHKNLRIVIEAIAELRSRLPRVVLMIVGRCPTHGSELIDLVTKYRLEDNIVFTGFVSRQELPVLYNMADVFVMPSQYEGFGLPVLEAMSCGCPVLSSNKSSLPEVIGDSGMLISPDNSHAWANALLEILEDRALNRTMSCAGIERSRIFDWRTTALRTIDAYRRAQ